MHPDEVWERVRAFALQCVAQRIPVFTLRRPVRNYITDVKPDSIGRISDDGVSNVSRVTRGMVANFWSELNGGSPGSGYLAFTEGLVAAALGDFVEVSDGVARLREKARRVYLLTWNPDEWDWHDLDEVLMLCLEKGGADYRWSTGNTRRIAKNDRFLMLKQGKHPRGIIGSGTFTSDVYEFEHHDPKRADRGDTALNANIRFDRLVSPDFPMQVEDIDEGPLRTVYWAVPASGTEIHEPALTELDRLWFEFRPPRPATMSPNELTPGVKYSEGTVTVVAANRYERDPRARTACLAHWGTTCVACKTSLGDIYGDIGRDFVHVHHLEPLHKSGGARPIDPVKDLRPVCPNCHAILHRRDPPMSIEELQEQIARTRG